MLTSTGQPSGASVSTVQVWNSLPSALRDDSLSLNTFSRLLKAYLFSTPPGAVAAFCDSGAVYKCHDLLTYLLTTNVEDGTTTRSPVVEYLVAGV